MDPEGDQQIVRLAGPGDLMGYRSLLAAEAYSATAETLEEAQICFIDKKTFFHVLETHPSRAFHVLSALAHDLGRAESQMVNLKGHYLIKHQKTDGNGKPSRVTLADLNHILT